MKQPRRGYHLLRVFFCHGCQSCFEIDPETEALKQNEHTLSVEDETEKLKALLSRASERLHDYCGEVNGDMNDALGTEIDKYLASLEPINWEA